MDLLYSISNFFEQKTIYEIEKSRNSILEILNFDEGDTRTKLKLISEKINSIIVMISEIFGNLKKKINEFEDNSVKRILRMKNSYKIFLKKFLN
jgi:hypothetical protein